MTNTLITRIPFQGYYETAYAELVDQNLTYDTDISVIPTKLAQEAWDLVYYTKDYIAAFTDLSKLYIESFQKTFNDATDLNISLTWESLISPKEYNFETDRVFAKISQSDIEKLYAFCDKAMLKAQIKANYTSRDGFISFYSSNLDTWLDIPLAKWDHNQLCELFLCAIAQTARGEESFESDLYDDLADYYSQGCGIDIQDAEYTRANADKKKVKRLEKLLDKIHNLARAA